MKSKLGWDKVPKNKQVLTSKVPSAVIDFIKVEAELKDVIQQM